MDYIQMIHFPRSEDHPGVLTSTAPQRFCNDKEIVHYSTGGKGRGRRGKGVLSHIL